MSIILKNKSRYKGDGIYIGRPSLLGNPYFIGKDGNRQKVIELYRQWLWKHVQSKSKVYEYLTDLAEKSKTQNLVLICHCVPLACHGQIIKSCIEWINKNGLN